MRCIGVGVLGGRLERGQRLDLKGRESHKYDGRGLPTQE